VLGISRRRDQNYFRTYDECVSNDFVLSEGGRKVDMITKDIEDWKITFVDTGLNSNIGQRLAKVRKYVGDDAGSWPTTLTVSPTCRWTCCTHRLKIAARSPASWREAHGQLSRDLVE
jgi:hypothetical protein